MEQKGTKHLIVLGPTYLVATFLIWPTFKADINKIFTYIILSIMQVSSFYNNNPFQSNNNNYYNLI